MKSSTSEWCVCCDLLLISLRMGQVLPGVGKLCQKCPLSYKGQAVDIKAWDTAAGRDVLVWSRDAFLAAFGGCALRKRGIKKKEPSGAFPAPFPLRKKAKLTSWYLGRT